MTSASISSNAGNFKSDKRYRGNRNRVDQIRLSDLSIDDLGNIIDGPPIAGLDCFGNPVEYHRGEFDEPYIRTQRDGKRVESARGCYGCKSRIACGEVSERRLEADDELLAKRDAWARDTPRLTRKKRYSHPSFTAFADACGKRVWTSAIPDATAAKRAADAKRKRKERAADKRKAKRGNQITPAMSSALESERGEREGALIAAVDQAGAPLWLRNLHYRSIALTCDVWKAWMLVGLRYGGDVKPADVTRALIKGGRDYGLPERSLGARVIEAMKRIDRLESEPKGAPVWGKIDAANV